MYNCFFCFYFILLCFLMMMMMMILLFGHLEANAEQSQTRHTSGLSICHVFGWLLRGFVVAFLFFFGGGGGARGDDGTFIGKQAKERPGILSQRRFVVLFRQCGGDRSGRRRGGCQVRRRVQRAEE